MKRSWIGFGLLLVLLAGGLLATWGMARLQEPIARNLERAASCALAEELDAAIPMAAEAERKWEENRRFSACFADHTPMEEIDALFAQMEIYAAAGEEAAFAAACAEISRKVEAIGEAHGLTWWNLL